MRETSQCCSSHVADSSGTESPTDFEAGRTLAVASREASSQHLEPSGLGDMANTAPIKSTSRFTPSHSAFEVPGHNFRPSIGTDPHRGTGGLPSPQTDTSNKSRYLNIDPNGLEVQINDASIRGQDYTPQAKAWEVGQRSESSPRTWTAAPPARAVVPEAHRDRSQHLSKAMQHMYY